MPTVRETHWSEVCLPVIPQVSRRLSSQVYNGISFLIGNTSPVLLRPAARHIGKVSEKTLMSRRGEGYPSINRVCDYFSIFPPVPCCVILASRLWKEIKTAEFVG